MYKKCSPADLIGMQYATDEVFDEFLVVLVGDGIADQGHRIMHIHDDMHDALVKEVVSSRQPHQEPIGLRLQELLMRNLVGEDVREAPYKQIDGEGVTLMLGQMCQQIGEVVNQGWSQALQHHLIDEVLLIHHKCHHGEGGTLVLVGEHTKQCIPH